MSKQIAKRDTAASLFGAGAERTTFEQTARARADASPSTAQLPWVIITITATFVFDC